MARLADGGFDPGRLRDHARHDRHQPRREPHAAREFWLLDSKTNIERADRLWPSIKDKGWRAASLKAWTFKVPWYRTGASLMSEWEAKHSGRKLEYDTGGFWNNMVLKYPGWRAREGFSQPPEGVPGEPDDPPGRR